MVSRPVRAGHAWMDAYCLLFYYLTISFNPHPPCRETPCGIGRLLCSGIFALPRKCTLQRCGKCGMDLRVEVGGELAAMSSFKLTGNGNFFHIHGTDSSIAARACILHRRAERASVVMELFICRRFLFFLKKSRCKITKQSDNFFRILKNNQKKMKQCEKVWRMCCVAPFGSPSSRRGSVAKKKAAMENSGLDILEGKS